MTVRDLNFLQIHGVVSEVVFNSVIFVLQEFNWKRNYLWFGFYFPKQKKNIDPGSNSLLGLLGLHLFICCCSVK